MMSHRSLKNEYIDAETKKEDEQMINNISENETGEEEEVVHNVEKVDDNYSSVVNSKNTTNTDDNVDTVSEIPHDDDTNIMDENDDTTNRSNSDENTIILNSNIDGYMSGDGDVINSSSDLMMTENDGDIEDNNQLAAEEINISATKEDDAYSHSDIVEEDDIKNSEAIKEKEKKDNDEKALENSSPDPYAELAKKLEELKEKILDEVRKSFVVGANEEKLPKLQTNKN